MFMPALEESMAIRGVSTGQSGGEAATGCMNASFPRAGPRVGGFMSNDSTPVEKAREAPELKREAC